jgi:hypothetical protein
LVCALVATVVGCGDGTAPTVGLADLSVPDTNTAVVVFDAPVLTGTVHVEARREYVYAVRTDRIPHTLMAEWAAGADTARVVFVISELYDAGPTTTDGTGNRFFWTDGRGNTWEPVTTCTLDVTEAYVFGTPSLQEIETACPVQSPAGEIVTIYAKARRWATLGG